MSQVEKQSGLQRSFCAFHSFSPGVIIKAKRIIAAGLVDVVILIISFAKQFIIDIDGFSWNMIDLTCILPYGSSSRRARGYFLLECSHCVRFPKGQLLRSSLASWCSLAKWAFFIVAPCYIDPPMRWRSSLLPLRSRFPDDTCNLNNIKFKLSIKTYHLYLYPWSGLRLRRGTVYFLIYWILFGRFRIYYGRFLHKSCEFEWDFYFDWLFFIFFEFLVCFECFEMLESFDFDLWCLEIFEWERDLDE